MSEKSIVMERSWKSTGIAEFYGSASVLVTGATGFVGKALLEKLLRSCEGIERVYVLVRPKRGCGVEERVKQLLKNPVFDATKKTNAKIFDKIKVIRGDVTQPNLGISQEHQNELIQNVNIVFHSAATVRFNEDLKDSVIQNTLGTKRILQLCSEMKHLKCFVHVSTAYCNARLKDVDEKVYETFLSPDDVIDYVENFPQEVIEMLSKRLVNDINGHPNTYTLTKALAEQVVKTYSERFKCVIVRPSIVTAAWKEPYPGWVDSFGGITGMMVEIGKGVVKSIICEGNKIKDVIPVDIVVNTIITGAWYSSIQGSEKLTVYNCTSGQINPILWKDFGRLTEKYSKEYPSKHVTLYPGFCYRTNRMIHLVSTVIYHFIPACALDLFLYLNGRKPIWLKICLKCTEISNNGEFFRVNEWNFHTTQFKRLIGATKLAHDGKHFDIDMSKGNYFDWDHYVKMYILGIRKYILKDDIKSLKEAKTKLNRIYWISTIFPLGLLSFVMGLVFRRYIYAYKKINSNRGFYSIAN